MVWLLIGTELCVLPNEIKLLGCCGYDGAVLMEQRGGASEVLMKHFVIMYTCGNPD